MYPLQILASKQSDAVFILLINVIMPTFVGILTFISRINFILSLDRIKIKFYNLETWRQGYKTFFMLNSTEHEISTAHKN